MAELQQALKKRNDEHENKWATPILGDWLYLGCARDAKNLVQLRQHQITHVLNVSDDVPNYFEAKESPVKYLKLFVQDFGCDAGISRVFNKAFDYINEAKKNGGKVLVHCMQGQNRSVTIVSAYLMNNENMSLKDAICHIRGTKRQACPFRDNREELVRYEASLFGVASMSVDDFLVSNLHRSQSEGAMTDLTQSCCIVKKSKTSRGVPPEFLSCSTNSLSMSSSAIPPPLSASSSLFHSAPAPSVNSLTSAFYSFSLNELPSQKEGTELSETTALDVTASDSLSPFPANTKSTAPMASPMLKSSTVSSLRRAQVIVEDEAKEESGRPRLLVTI